MPEPLSLKTGFWSAGFSASLGIAYMVILMIMALKGIGFPPTGTYELLIHLLILITAPVLVVWMAAIHRTAPPERSVFSLAALAFTILFATMTTINRWVALTMVRFLQPATATPGLEWFLPYGWPSVMLSLEILGWGYFLGLALVFAALVFHGNRLERLILWTFLVSGLLCLVTAFGWTVNNQSLVWFGVIAWGPGLTLSACLTALRFRHRIKPDA